VTEALIAAARDGDARSVARLISWVEDGAPQLREVLPAIADGGRATVIGLTGAPGVGKSTTTSALISAMRSRGDRVAVLAFDPTSPFTGGALLGDRVRMADHATDRGVYIRSMATRGHLGGLSVAAPQAIRLLEGLGFGVVLVETVGVGQSEVEVAASADTTVVLLAPGMGDGIQAAKAGILEVGDLFVVNKADREGAQTTAGELRHMIALGAATGDRRAAGEWRPPVLLTVASTGQGIDELVAALAEHSAWLAASGEGDARRRRRAEAEIEALAVATIRGRLDRQRLTELAEAVAAGRRDAFGAAAELAAE
jgi:LAO/AO transport system kinase